MNHIQGAVRRTATALTCAALLATAGAHAEELAVGTEINAANWEQMKTQTFEGKTIESMVPDKILLAVREHGLKIWLRQSEPMTYASHIMEATAKYAPDVRYDPGTRRVENYVAGIPFPDAAAIQAAPPEQAGDMIMYNVFYAGVANGDYSNCYGDVAMAIIDSKRGIQRMQGGYAIVYRTKGRTTGGPTQVGDDPNLRKVQIISFHTPYDIAGIGVYRKVYDDGRLDDIYAYVKSVRRVRRLSGGTWMDTLSTSDILNDDTYAYEAHPMWYPRITLKEKRWVLWPVHSPAVEKHDLADVLNYKDPPHWTFINKWWEPREVYVVEITTPKGHPYGKKISYVDTQLPAVFWTEAYTPGDEFWRLIYATLAPAPPGPQDGGAPPMYQLYNFGAWDFRTQHGNYMDCGRYDWNLPVKFEDMTTRLLVEASEGKRQGQHTEFGKGP